MPSEKKMLVFPTINGTYTKDIRAASMPSQPTDAMPREVVPVHVKSVRRVRLLMRRAALEEA